VEPPGPDGAAVSRGRGRGSRGGRRFICAIVLLCVLLVGALVPTAGVAAGLAAELALLGTRELAGPCFRR
jgi:hypothetical protein